MQQGARDQPYGGWKLGSTRPGMELSLDLKAGTSIDSMIQSPSQWEWETCKAGSLAPTWLECVLNSWPGDNKTDAKSTANVELGFWNMPEDYFQQHLSLYFNHQKLKKCLHANDLIYWSSCYKTHTKNSFAVYICFGFPGDLWHPKSNNFGLFHLQQWADWSSEKVD